VKILKIKKRILQCKQQTTKQGAKRNAELGVYMIESDGYTSESDASAYSEATHGYDADDTCDDASAEEGNDLTVNADTDDHLQEESSRKRKIYQEKVNFLPQIQDVFFLTKQHQYVIRKMERSLVILRMVQVWQNLPIALTKFNLQYPAHTKVSMLHLLTQASSLTSS
jgi:hypothetical protein